MEKNRFCIINININPENGQIIQPELLNTYSLMTILLGVSDQLKAKFYNHNVISFTRSQDYITFTIFFLPLKGSPVCSKQLFFLIKLFC